jgi:L-ascorbate metabolism protein UlaG (beta-lactamase superfamily)
MQLTYFGHSSFYIEMNGAHLVIDPFISPNEKAAGIDVDAIQASYILVSHGHGDHLADVERIARNNKAVIISNYEIVGWFEQKGLKGHPLNHGGKKAFDFATIKYVYSTHGSMLPDGSYGGNPGGFVVWNDRNCFYFAGDTALSMDMKLIPMTCPKLDFAILPIGDNFTMGYEDAALAADFIECDTIIGCHYDTFGYIVIDHHAAKKAFSDRGKRLLLPAIGETLNF